MSHVSVTINGRQYRMACEEGQEGHLLRLAKELDGRIEQLRGSFGEIGDMRLSIMTALMLSDELLETNRKVRSLEEEIAGMREVRSMAADRSQATQAAMISALSSAAERIEQIARTLNGSLRDEVAIG